MEGNNKVRTEINEIKTEKQQRRSMKQKTTSLERSIKLTNLWQTDQKEKEKDQENTNCPNRNKTEDITTNSADIKRMIRQYCKQLYTQKYDN